VRLLPQQQRVLVPFPLRRLSDAALTIYGDIRNRLRLVVNVGQTSMNVYVYFTRWRKTNAPRLGLRTASWTQAAEASR